MTRIMLVEDDIALAELIASYLQRFEYDVTVVNRGDRALEGMHRLRPDLVILDLMLPGLDGLHVCRQLRDESPVLPIIMLTARDKNDDQILGLETGADDYVAKPCDPRVLLARIRTLLRRSLSSETRHDAQQIVLGRLLIDLAERQVKWRDQDVELSSGEYNLLLVLANHAGEVLSRDQLIQQLRGIEFNGIDRSVDVAISKLRRKFEDNPAEPRRIKTVWGKGYLLSRSEWDE
ncbi:response regulator [Pseudomonas cichorii]|uniref:response regulator n=1 Tax=Pseudomonas lijiangensis TaxID=2995658 RepID=UPI001C88456E|nr:response regulator [Pseudomonas cichorii]MBX8510420.1 response regulator [Pseudomonas cichorii]MBX8523912.1 response regulator [Pseudomonas cichorii]MBX8536481.1 response regulator [Pseudomonas cichorii]MBX8539039.1 response regulator [Pseudomonas cichorii]MBX8559388.1 response regulator [Pseudomonas cichorii]